MPFKDIEEIITDLRNEADKDCTCTEDQETGKDPTTCKRCQAAHRINQVGELLREEME